MQVNLESRDGKAIEVNINIYLRFSYQQFGKKKQLTYRAALVQTITQTGKGTQ